MNSGDANRRWGSVCNHQIGAFVPGIETTLPSTFCPRVKFMAVTARPPRINLALTLRFALSNLNADL
jgi:hypothetical protein